MGDAGLAAFCKLLLVQAQVLKQAVFPKLSLVFVGGWIIGNLCGGGPGNSKLNHGRRTNGKQKQLVNSSVRRSPRDCEKLNPG